jgi:hypothetical protein
MDPFYAFLIFAALVALETLAHQFALPGFFRIGLPVYLARRAVTGRPTAADLAAALANQVGPTQGLPVMHFPVLSPSEIAVQERLFENRSRGRFLPVMHSALRLDSASSRLTITGYLNLYVLAAIGYIIYRTLQDQTFLPVGLLLLALFVMSYVIQASLNQRILATACQLI